MNNSSAWNKIWRPDLYICRNVETYLFFIISTIIIIIIFFLPGHQLAETFTILTGTNKTKMLIMLIVLMFVCFGRRKDDISDHNHYRQLKFYPVLVQRMQAEEALTTFSTSYLVLIQTLPCIIATILIERTQASNSRYHVIILIQITYTFCEHHHFVPKLDS